MIWGLGIVALLAGLYWFTNRPGTYRYRITVEVETPQGLKSGSAVREVKWFRQPGMAGNKFTLKQRGEAVAVDLPGGQTLFALMDVNGDDTLLAAFRQGSTLELKPLLDRANDDRKLYVLPARETLRPQNLDLPRQVRFRDLSDPTSVEGVDPDDLESSFGQGVRLRRIAVQMTDDPVTADVVKRLAWLSEHPEPRLDRRYAGSTSPTLPQRLSHGDFRRGMK